MTAQVTRMRITDPDCRDYDYYLNGVMQTDLVEADAEAGFVVHRLQANRYTTGFRACRYVREEGKVEILPAGSPYPGAPAASSVHEPLVSAPFSLPENDTNTPQNVPKEEEPKR